MDPHDQQAFDAYAGRRRADCSGGRRQFNLMPDGQLSRCAELRDNIGNILHHATRCRLQRPQWPCERPVCNWQCRGGLTEQTMDDGDFSMGRELIRRELAGRNYCTLAWEMTARCTARCAYCCGRWWMDHALESGRYEMSVDEALDVANWFCGEYETGYCMLLGGEPALHPALGSCVRRFCAGGWQVEIGTNFDLPAVILDVVSSVPVMDRRTLAVVASAHVHRPGFSLETFVDGIRRLRSAMWLQNLIHVLYIDHPLNHQHLPFATLEERSMQAGASRVTLVHDFTADWR